MSGRGFAAGALLMVGIAFAVVSTQVRTPLAVAVALGISLVLGGFGCSLLTGRRRKP